MSHSLKNIPLRVFRQYLEWKGLKVQRISGGHEIWAGRSVTRPICLQTHIDPVPEFIVRQALRALNADRDDFIAFLKNG
jgi:hypothetical protein